MPPTKAPSMRRSSAPLPALLALMVGFGFAVSARAQDGAADKPILAAPPMVWDHSMLSVRPLLTQTVSDLTAITSRISFGMGPGEVNDRLPHPTKGIAWNTIPAAMEFRDDVRYFWIRFDDARDPRMGATACVGSDSHVVFMFQPRGLFRISYRLVPDVACPHPAGAAEQIFGRFVGLADGIVRSAHYRAGTMEIVDLTDPTASTDLLATRWQPKAEN